ncbi:hypothetical protein ACWD6L_02445 [Micromonospora profundi]
MRLQLTVADPSTAVIDYQVEAAPDTTVGELAEALAARRPEPADTPRRSSSLVRRWTRDSPSPKPRCGRARCSAWTARCPRRPRNRRV